jgi:hypothetical protein
MNHNITSADVKRRFRTKKSRPPVRTTAEIAEQLGVTPNSLGGYLGTDPNAPKPAFKALSSVKGPKTYYNPAEVIAWWRQKTEKTET